MTAMSCRRMICAFFVGMTISLATLAQQSQTSCDTTRDHALYSQNATVLGRVSAVRVKSPDGKKSLTMERVAATTNDIGSETLIRYTVSAGGKRFSAQLPGFNAEVSWAPDSSAFAVTETEGGGGIGYEVYIFFIGDNGLHRVNLSPLVAPAVVPPKCEVPVVPNVGFIGWLDSRRVLVAAEIVPVSICQCSGTFKAVEIVLPENRPLTAYAQKVAKKKFWNMLGCELRDADDDCVYNPELHNQNQDSK
jgi:hypothetical protein